MVDSTRLPNVDINKIATDLNNKMDRDGVNASCPVCLSRTPNEQGGVVEIWSDGYCVQTGISKGNEVWGVKTITLDQEYITDYVINLISFGSSTDFTSTNTSSARGSSRSYYTNKTNSSFQIQSFFDTNWRVEGYIR